MATQSQCRWVCTRPAHSDPFSFSSSSSCSSSSSYNPSFIYSFNTAFVKRHCVKACCLRNSSSSCTSSSVPRPRKPVKLEGSGSGREEFGGNPKKEALLEFLNQIETQKRETLSLRPLVGKRSLWRRVLFASRKVRSIVLLNVITVVYASNIPVVKEVQAIMNPAAFTVVRFAVSAIPFIPFVLQERGDTHTRNAGMELGFWVSLGYLTQALGLLTCDAGRASFLSMFTVIVVPLLDGMLGAVVPTRTWFGALMSIVGVGMLECSGSPPCIGDLLNFFSAVFFGIHMLRTEHISRTINKKKFLPLLGYEICVVALSSTLWYLAGGCFGGVQDHWPLSWTWSTLRDWIVNFPWIPAIYTGAFSTGLCLWIEMAAMQDVSATETAIIYALEPVWGAGFAWFLLGERWGVAGWIGAVLVLGGSLTVQIFGASTSPSESSKGPKESKEGDSTCL